MHVQPVGVVHVLEDAVEARPEEADVQLLEDGQDAGEELFQGDRLQGFSGGGGEGGGEGVERGGGRGVGRVQADPHDGDVLAGRVVRVDEDAADLGVGLFVSVGGGGGVEGIYR